MYYISKVYKYEIRIFFLNKHVKLEKMIKSALFKAPSLVIHFFHVSDNYHRKNLPLLLRTIYRILIFCLWNSQNKSTFHRDTKMTSFCNEQAICQMCFCAFPFSCRSTHQLPVFWIFLLSRSQLKTICCSVICFCICESSSFNNVCNYISLNLVGGFLCSSSSFLSFVEVTTSETSKASFTRVLRWSIFTISFSKQSIRFSDIFLEMKTKN